MEVPQCPGAPARSQQQRQTMGSPTHSQAAEWQAASDFNHPTHPLLSPVCLRTTQETKDTVGRTRFDSKTHSMTTLSPMSKLLTEVGKEWNDAVRANAPVDTDWEDDSSAGGNVRNMTPSAFDPA